ncbi:antitoxin [Archaeoglobales archaeon]|nr:MAG: antitoxin [Archaeoglobales archaeon]
MPKVIEVIYEDGVFKPLEKVELKEKTKARVILDDAGLSQFFGIFKKKVSVDEERDLMIKERV